MKKSILLLLLTAAIFSVGITQDAATSRKKQFNLEDGLAIQGFDPVAYILQNKALKGSTDLALYHQGVTYYFSSVNNKEEFKKNPARFEPEYGGWCAYAMGEKGEKVSVDPKTFKIIGGRLYLFYNKFFNNTLTDWNKDETNLKKNADANWKKFYK